MAGLPHFSNSVASRNNYEPVYLNQFEVIINPPAGIPLAAQRFKGEGILAQGIKSLSGLAVDIAPSATIDQNYLCVIVYLAVLLYLQLKNGCLIIFFGIHFFQKSIH